MSRPWIAAYVASDQGRRFAARAGTEAAETYAATAYVGTYASPADWAQQCTTPAEWADAECTTAAEYAAAVDTRWNGAVDYVPTGDGRVFVYIEN